MARTFHAWLREQIGRGTPLDDLAVLLTAEVNYHEFGPANFYRVVDDARSQAEYVGRVFMGVRIGCANCHNHPLDRWTQDDYHGLAAVFARIDRGRNVRVLARGSVTHPHPGEPAEPRLPGGRALDPDDDPRVALADWLTTDENPYFSPRPWSIGSGPRCSDAAWSSRSMAHEQVRPGHSSRTSQGPGG